MFPVLVTGASGFLGNHIARVLATRGYEVIGAFRTGADRVPRQADPLALDLLDLASVERAVFARRPGAIVHAAAIADARACEEDPKRAWLVNVEATRRLARLAADAGAAFVFLSTDQVYAGDRGPYREDDPAEPVQSYGRTKRDAEREAAAAHPRATILRVALVYGTSPTGDRSASEKVLLDLGAGRRPRLFADEIRSPVLADDVASVVGDLIAEPRPGVFNLGGPDRASRYDLGVAVARAFGLDPGRIDAASLDEVDRMPRRPRDVSLDTARLRSAVRHRPRGLEEGLRWVARSSSGGAAEPVER